MDHDITDNGSDLESLGYMIAEMLYDMHMPWTDEVDIKVVRSLKQDFVQNLMKGKSPIARYFARVNENTPATSFSMSSDLSVHKDILIILQSMY